MPMRAYNSELAVQSSNVGQYPNAPEPTFLYFAYGSCMCPVDLKRSLQEDVCSYVIGPATLNGYRLGFYHYWSRRDCGVLDVVADRHASVEGVLYRLPLRLSDRLDEREAVGEGDYRHHTVEVEIGQALYRDVRTYVVVNKRASELAPNDWYSSVVLRGALTCGLSEQYCWQLFDHMRWLQTRASA